MVVERRGGERGGGIRGGVGPPLCCFNCRPVSGQLLIHSSFTTTTNRGHTRAGQQSKAGQDTGRQSYPPPHSQFLHCRYRNRAVSKGLAVLLSPSFSFLFPSLFDSTLWLLSPLSLPLPSILLLLSPASLEQISSCLSLTLSKCTGSETSHCSVAAAICLAADSKVDSDFLSRLSIAVLLQSPVTKTRHKTFSS